MQSSLPSSPTPDRRPARSLGALAVFSASLCLGGALRAQNPTPAPKPVPASNQKSINEQLDAEREKLRAKDVEEWKTLKIKSMDQVIDVKKTTQALELPPMTDQEKAQIAELLQKAKTAGGAQSNRALRKLEKMGYPALISIVNELREIDYKNTEQAEWGMMLNMTLQEMTLGINTGYVAIEPGETMDPRKAQYNALTVANWQLGVKKFWSTKEKYEQYIKDRKAKKEAELEGDKPDDKGKAPDKKGDEKKGG